MFFYVTVCEMSDREDTDMTALVSSLVQLILDDHCQTVEGFQDLIDREWIALGHPWVSRYSTSSTEKVTFDWMSGLLMRPEKDEIEARKCEANA